MLVLHVFWDPGTASIRRTGVCNLKSTWRDLENPVDPRGIKTMKLYHQVDRVFDELTALGFGPEDPVDVTVLSNFDQYHYLGTEAVDEGIKRLAISANMSVLDVGGGIGGPSRHIAHSTGCQITALELQPDLDETARELTRRCGLSGKVTHLCGDILNGAPETEHYDALVSWLTFAHIPDRARLYARCFEALRPGGGLYAEDFFDRAALTKAEKKVLSIDVAIDYTPSFETYRNDLIDAGFVDIDLTDVSEPWTLYLGERAKGYRDNWDRNVSLHRAELVEGLDHFYFEVGKLFQGGNLGGIRIEAWKPS